MNRRALSSLALLALAALLAMPSPSGSRISDGGSAITVHEWGTFTSVAGPDGQFIEWLALTGSTDLPGFVEHFQGGNFKCGLGGTIRMETPVMYFYSSQETTVSVRVSFTRGLITEWYPHAAVEPIKVQSNHGDGQIRWEHVRLLPDARVAFRTGDSGNRYFAARKTSATPVRVAGRTGKQDEKFLFYRGVSWAAPPISARLDPRGKVAVKIAGGDGTPVIMRIESRSGKLGYRLVRAANGAVALDTPALRASPGAMLQELEGILEAQGLYADEARAMIATWQNSWFEEGSRLLYIVPAHALDTLLPLTVTPAPSSIARVFVGRMELVTPATEKAVEQAFGTDDQQALGRYHRFLEPILRAMMEESAPDPARRNVLGEYLNLVFSYACRSPWPDAQ